MSGHDDADEVHALSGAYAVDALDTEERARFEEHLRSCPTCRTEVDELRGTAALLASDADAEPPAGLRDSILAGIETVRPLPPLAPATGDGSSAARTSAPTDRRSVRRLPFRGTPLLAAAAAVVLVALVGLAAWRPWAEPDDAPTAAERVLAADDATRASQELPDGSRATVVVSRSEGAAVIVTEDMAPAPDGKVYELWLEEPDGKLAPAGLMPDDSDATVLLDGDATDATGVGVTVEPDGGSPQPTTEPVLFFELEA